MPAPATLPLPAPVEKPAPIKVPIEPEERPVMPPLPSIDPGPFAPPPFIKPGQEPNPKA